MKPGIERGGELPVIDFGLLAAWRFDPEGRAEKLRWNGAPNAMPAAPLEEGWMWLHGHRDSGYIKTWLFEASGVPETAVWAMLEEDTAPRVLRFPEGTVLILRAINLNPGAEPEDMLSIRLFVSPRRVVSLVSRRIKAVGGILLDCENGRGPANVNDFIVRLIEDLRSNAEPILDDLQEDIETFEIDILGEGKGGPAPHHATLNDARQDMIMLRRHLAPQAEALRKLVALPPDWLTETEAVREEAEAFQRIVGDLDALRERAALVRDDMYMRLGEEQNRTILMLSLVSAVFLPISFIAGMLGSNVPGIPFSGSPHGFWMWMGLIAAVVVFEIWLMKRLKLF